MRPAHTYRRRDKVLPLAVVRARAARIDAVRTGTELALMDLYMRSTARAASQGDPYWSPPLGWHLSDDPATSPREGALVLHGAQEKWLRGVLEGQRVVLRRR